MSYLYAENRKNFRSAAKITDDVASYLLPGYRGRYGEDLAMDVASIGERAASKVVVISSGIHGVELPFGSSLQCAWLKSAHEVASKDSDIRFVFVHALNPYGASWGLRTDQNNLDLNRNFIDFSAPHSVSDEYRFLYDALNPKKLDEATIKRSWKKLRDFGEKHGYASLKQAFAGGQYVFPEGLYYGGNKPSWTRETWQKVIETHAVHERTKKVWHLDLHTGAGPWAKLQLMASTEENSDLYKRVLALDPARKYVTITSQSLAQLSGDIVDFWPHLVPLSVEVTPVAFETGTSRKEGPYEDLDNLDAVMRRNVLRQRYGGDAPQAKKITRNLQLAFYPMDRAWRRKATHKANEAWRRVLAAASL